MKTEKRKGRPPTGKTKEKVTITIDKKALPAFRQTASRMNGLSALVEKLLFDFCDKDRPGDERRTERVYSVVE